QGAGHAFQQTIGACSRGPENQHPPSDVRHDQAYKTRSVFTSLAAEWMSQRAYFAAVSGGAGIKGSRFGSPRAPRTSNSSNNKEGATTEAGRPPFADPTAPRAVPEKP